MNKKTKIIICFYIFLAVGLVVAFIHIDSTFGCEDFYPATECQKPGGPEPDKTRLTFEPVDGKDWVRPTLQFANPKLGEVIVEREYLVGKEVLFNTMADVENWPMILPKTILSVTIVEREPNVILAEETMLERGIRVNLLAKHTLLPYESHTVEIMSGDAKGTKIIQTFTGDELSTKLSTKIKLELQGLLGPLYFFPKSNFSHAINTVNSAFADYSKGFDSEYEKIVDNTYRKVLLRPADSQSLEYWAPLLESGTVTEDEFKNQLVKTEEAFSVMRGQYTPAEDVVAGLTDEEIKIVDDIYRELLQRPVDIMGLAYWGAPLSLYNKCPYIDDPREEMLCAGALNEEEIRKYVYDSQEAAEIRIDEEAWKSVEIKSITGINLKIFQDFENKVNMTYYSIFGKWPDYRVKVHYIELLYFRVLDGKGLYAEFLAGENICVHDDTSEVGWNTPNDSEICDFIHPNKTIMPEDWDKETMMEYWRTQPQNTG